METTLSAGSDRIALMHTLVRIVEAGSLSAAALQLGTTQPTVSRRLQQLERTLGLRLLQRSTHGMKLTVDGERCYAHAKSLVHEWEAMEADLRGVQDVPRGQLRVLVPHAFGQDQLMAPLLDYLRRYPEVQVEWLLHDRRADFIAEGIDCAIQVGQVLDPAAIALRLAEVPRIVVAAPPLVAQHPPATAAQDLADWPWMALNTFYQREVCLTHAQHGMQRFAIQPRLSTDSLYALRSAALAGLGVGIASAWMVQEDLRAGRLQHLVEGWEAAPLPVSLVYPQAAFYPARLRCFLDAMRAAMPRLTGMRAATRGSARR
jgi:DNA-binding transcriptional LysR family regulator